MPILQDSKWKDITDGLYCYNWKATQYHNKL